jgi:hypothetical protein
MIRWLFTTFIALTILSACWPWLAKLGIGRMPGDVRLRLGERAYALPFMSTIVVLLVLTLVVRLI